jgi:hypothetical protein
VANTLADYDMATITAVKSFIVQAPGLFLLVAVVCQEVVFWIGGEGRGERKGEASLVYRLRITMEFITKS